MLRTNSNSHLSNTHRYQLTDASCTVVQCIWHNPCDIWWSKIQDAAKSPVNFMHQARRYLPDLIREIRLVERGKRRDVDD